MLTIREETFSLVFEPIVNLTSDKIVGFEGLSRSINNNVNSEVFFKEINVDEHIRLLDMQLLKYQKWVQQHPEIYGDKWLHLNVNQELLLTLDFHTIFIPYNRYFPIHLEVELVKPLTHAQQVAINSIIMSNDMKVWLDDYTGGTLPIHRMAWSGIKLDKYFFWSLLGEDDVDSVFSSQLCTEFDIICEGIETNEQKDIAVDLGMKYGQGYLWSVHN